jgi:hypothetical protein
MNPQWAILARACSAGAVDGYIGTKAREILNARFCFSILLTLARRTVVWLNSSLITQVV